MVPVKNLGELRWYGGCHYTCEREMGTLTISQKTFADELVKTFCETSTQSVPLRVGVKLEEFDEDEKVENWAFREVGSLMWLSISTRTDIANAVQAVARYLFLLLLFLTFSALVANPKKTTVHGGQSRSWSAEQENKTKNGSPPPPLRCSFGENKK